jgi:hypothetical protein
VSDIIPGLKKAEHKGADGPLESMLDAHDRGEKYADGRRGRLVLSTERTFK